MNLFQCYVLIKMLNVIAALQAHQTIILIKSHLLKNGLFVKSIFHSKCHIYGFAMQIGWDILLKYTWDFSALPWHIDLIGVRGEEDGWRLSRAGCQETKGGCNVVLYLREMSLIENGSSHMDSNPDTSRILTQTAQRWSVQRKCVGSSK